MKRSMRFARLMFVFPLGFILFSASAQTRNFVVNPATVCRCDIGGFDNECAGINEKWRHTVDHLLEVSAVDFRHGDYVGTECQAECDDDLWEWQFSFNAWRPFDGLKHNLSGTLHHFDWAYDADEDWNIYVTPKSEFSFLIDDVEAVHDDSIEWHRECGEGERRCLEAEVSPDKQFWNNPWFFAPGVRPEDTKDNGFSLLEGRQVGLYGLWITDADHESKSEIHPLDMMWFKDHFARGLSGSGPPLDIFWLFNLEDNTGQFDDRDNFDCDGDAPFGWRPWTDAPRFGQFNVAFEVDPNQEVVNFFIEELFSRFVVTGGDAEARGDADDGKSHALEFNGKVVVRVEELQPNDDDLGVTFTDICLRPDGKLQGFVSIRSKIGGNDDKDEEGFHILYAARSVDRTRPDAVFPGVSQLPRLLATAEELGGSLQPHGDFLTGDLQLTLHSNRFTRKQDLNIAKVDFVGKDLRRRLKFKQNKRTKDVVISAVPLVGNGRIIMTSASGLKTIRQSPAVGLFPGIEETIKRSEVEASAWKYVPASVGGIAGTPLPKDQKLAAIQELQLRLHPRYAASNGTKIMTDKTSAFATRLNSVIRKGGDKYSSGLLRFAEPSKITWSFAATNLSTGKTVPVNTAYRGGAEGVKIEFLSEKLPNDLLKVRFGSQAFQGIIELRAKATVTDKQGKTTFIEQRTWSHGFQFDSKNVEACTSLLQALTGLKDRSALIAPAIDRKQPIFSSLMDSQTRRANITNAYLRLAMRDKLLTIDELSDVIRALKKFSAVGYKENSGAQ